MDNNTSKFKYMRLLFTFMGQTGAKEKGPVNCQVFTTLML